MIKAWKNNLLNRGILCKLLRLINEKKRKKE